MAAEGPVVKTQMLIRRPVAEVYEAFIDPAITRNFWFTKSSGRMEPGKTLLWEWEMYGVGAEVDVKALEPNRRILIEWGEPRCPVEWQFDDRGEEGTVVTVSNWGFSGTEDEVVAKALDSMQGFTLLLSGLKAWLEHELDLKLVGDCHPDARRD